MAAAPSGFLFFTPPSYLESGYLVQAISRTFSNSSKFEANVARPSITTYFAVLMVIDARFYGSPAGLPDFS
jgi:hypothetical protein